jgi:predicted RNA binding protein YcfA (HicA-like mRNA interferase family)
MRVRETIRLLRDDRWYLVATSGSHRQFRELSPPSSDRQS